MRTPQLSDVRPRLISIAASPYCELARWILDRRGIAYFEEAHAPVLHQQATRRFGGGGEVPVLATTQGTFADARQVVNYFEAATADDSLWPADRSARSRSEELYELFYRRLGVAVRAWTLAHLLPERGTMAGLWAAGAPLQERLIVKAAYPALAAALRRTFAIGSRTALEELTNIIAVFDRVGSLLADGRPFVAGDRLSVADVTLASLAAPTVLPEEYGGVLPTLDELPPAMRADVARLRNHPTGQLILRLYREQRPRSAAVAEVPGPVKADSKLMPPLNIWAPNLKVLRAASAMLRQFAPILVVGNRVVVSRHADVLEVLTRDTDFTVAEVNAKRFDELQGRFILGMDRSPEYERDASTLRQVVRPDDLERVRRLVTAYAAELVDASLPRGRIEMVGGLTRVAPARLIAPTSACPARTSGR